MSKKKIEKRNTEKRNLDFLLIGNGFSMFDNNKISKKNKTEEEVSDILNPSKNLNKDYGNTLNPPENHNENFGLLSLVELEEKLFGNNHEKSFEINDIDDTLNPPENLNGNSGLIVSEEEQEEVLFTPIM